MCMRACLYRAFCITLDVSVTFWGHVLPIWGKTPYSPGTCVVDTANGQVATWDVDYVWVLEVSLARNMYGLFITQIASMNNTNNY